MPGADESGSGGRGDAAVSATLRLDSKRSPRSQGRTTYRSPLAACALGADWSVAGGNGSTLMVVAAAVARGEDGSGFGVASFAASDGRAGAAGKGSEGGVKAGGSRPSGGGTPGGFGGLVRQAAGYAWIASMFSPERSLPAAIVAVPTRASALNPHKGECESAVLHPPVSLGAMSSMSETPREP